MKDTGPAADDWGPWEIVDLKGIIAGTRFEAPLMTASFPVAHRNERFTVFDRTNDHGVRHFGIRKGDGTRPTWWEAQRIKNELAGEDFTAIEIYPPQGEVIDGANVFHIWVLPDGTRFNFGLWDITGEKP